MREIMKRVSHQQARQLLHNKFIVVVGDSIMRSVYKDLVLLLQKDKYLSVRQLKSKGEMSFEQDCLVEGGCLDQMHNGTEYREVRQFQSGHHLVRFYFVTRIYSRYMESILADFRHGLTPDVVIVNSCVWDISRYRNNWIEDYKENLHKFFNELREILPEGSADSLVVWNLTMPLGERLRGGFLVPEIEHRASQLRQDVIEANFYSATLADSYGLDVLDLHFQFRFSLQHRTGDGVHWNAIAHRKITSLLLEHSAQAWGVAMPCPLTAVEDAEVTDQQPGRGKDATAAGHAAAFSDWCRTAPPKTSNTGRHPPNRKHNGHDEAFSSDSLPFGYLSFEENYPQPQKCHRGPAGAHRRTDGPLLNLHFHRHQQKHGQVRNGFGDRRLHHFEPYSQRQHQHVMRSRHPKHHYAPYDQHRPRPRQYARRGPYY